MMLHRPITRRRALRGIGATIALPFFESLMPRSLRTRSLAPKRAAFLFMPNGVHPDKWTPDEAGTEFNFSPIMAPLSGLKEDLLVVSHLMNKNSDTREDGHYTKTANFLTSMRIQKTTGANINSGGVSLDQILAQHHGHETLFPSLVYGIDRITSGVDKNVGFTRLYGSSISWKSATQPCSKEIEPRMAFDRLFQRFIPGRPEEEVPAWRKSVLDQVLEDAHSLKNDLGVEDQNKLAEYLEAIRSVEQRIESRDRIEAFKDHITPDIQKEIVSMDSRIQDFVEYKSGMDVTEKTRLMLDIIALAFWSDATRFASFMFGNSVSNRNFSFLEGVSGNHHSISHHKNDPRQLDQYERINRWHIEQYTYLLDRLKSIPEGDGTLLDHSLVLFGSGLRDGNRHSPVNLPILLGGRAGGALQTGMHVSFDPKTPLANLYQSILHIWGVEGIQFADSTGLLNPIHA